MFTVQECKDMISLYIEAEKAVLAGKRYKIGTREVERVDLNDIVTQRKAWENRLKLVENGGKRRNIRGIVPRDL